jgi:hypothetical protein
MKIKVIFIVLQRSVWIFMRARLFLHITSFFFAALLICKSLAFISIAFYSHSSIEIAEMMMDTEQEEKKGNKAETGIDELLDKAILPPEEFTPGSKSSRPMPAEQGSLPAIYLDLLTPPPNA